MKRPFVTRRPALLVPVALCFGLLIPVALVAEAIKVNLANEEVRFSATAVQLRDLVFRRLTAAHESVHGLAALFNASTEVDSEEFRIVGADLLSRLGDIEILQYMPRVAQTDKDRFEEQMHDSGYVGFRIWRFDDGRRVEVGDQSSYFPLRFVEPFTPSSVAQIGFDALSDPQMAKAARRAIDSAQVAVMATPADGSIRQLQLIKALYVGKEAPSTTGARSEQVNGLLVVRVGLAHLLASLTRSQDMTVRLDLLDRDGQVVVPLMDPEQTLQPAAWLMLSPHNARFSLAFPEHGFRMSFHQPVPWQQVLHGPVWIALASGLVLAALLYVMAQNVANRTTELQRRNRVIAEIVQRQTAELLREKGRLEREIDERKAAESRLQQQQASLLGLATREAMVGERLDSVLQNICQTAARTLSVARVSVWLYDDSHRQLHCVALCEERGARDVGGLSLSADEFPAYFSALETGRIIAADDARSDARTGEFLDGYLVPLGITSMLEAPVRRGGALSGVVCHEHVGTPRRWSLDEQSFAGSVADMVTLALELQERRQTESEMVKLSRALEKTADSVVITDRNGVIEYVNAAFVETTGFSRTEVIGQRPSIVSSGRHDQAFYQRLWECILDGRDFRDVLVNKRKDGTLYYEEMTITPLRDALGEITHFVSTGKDITERMQTQEHLHFLAHHDVLTELPNRSLFIERLEHALQQHRRNGRQLAVLFLDLDRFKNINDTLGHEAGDLLLQAVAERLQSCVRNVDTVARLGGDEFTLLVEDVEDSDHLRLVAQKVLSILAEPINLFDHELFVTTSIGIAVCPNDGDDALSLLKHADTAMYKAKESGRNTYHFYSAEMSSRAVARLTLEASLRHAIDRGEFVLHYQPQLDVRSESIVGVEALIRWEKPGDGMVSPDDFIPLLEETGLIVPVGEWVLRTACTQAVNWVSLQPTPIRMAVNLSARQFADPELAARIEQILKETGCPPELLDVEITESMIMHNANAAVAVMQRLRALGIRVAIDDFGTGYSSLSYLKRFPIHTLKVDRSFIRDITEDPDDAAIVQSVVAMAHALKLEVIAEGVETPAQAAFLRGCECDALQGYLYAAPMSAGDFERLIGKGPLRMSITAG